jgi:hypothetical protein
MGKIVDVRTEKYGVLTIHDVFEISQDDQFLHLRRINGRHEWVSFAKEAVLGVKVYNGCVKNREENAR